MGFWRSRYKQYAKCDSYRRVRHITRYVCALRAGVGASSLSVVVTMKNGIEMSSKQISRQNCNIGQYLVQYISIFMLLWSILCFFFILHFFSLFVRLFFSCSFSIVRSFLCLFVWKWYGLSSVLYHCMSISVCICANGEYESVFLCTLRTIKAK